MIEKDSVKLLREEGIQGPYELPKGWRWARIKNISHKPQYGFTAPAQVEAVGPKMLRITDIQNGQVNWDLVPYCIIKNNELEKYKLEKGDILFARTGATTGKTFLIEESPKSVFASYLIKLRVLREKAVSKYVYSFFQSPQYWEQIKPRGGAQPNMNARILSNLKIPLPPVEEQKRIVARIEELFSKLEEIRRVRKETSAKAKRLLPSALHEAFLKADEKGWRWVKLQEIVCMRKQTISPRDFPDEEFELYSIPAYHTSGFAEIQRGSEIGSSKFLVNPEDVLFGKLNPHIPKVWLVSDKGRYRQIATTEFFPIHPKNSKELSTEYLSWCMKDKGFLESVVKLVIGTTGSRKRLQKGDFLNLKIPLPSLEEQKRIVVYLEKIQQKTAVLRRLQEETEGKVNKLRASILNRAFGGGL